MKGLSLVHFTSCSHRSFCFFDLSIPLYCSNLFHQEMLPTPLILAVASQREGVPFPAFVEAFGMEVAFELLREAGVRLPKVIGPAVSIVGALIVGEASIRAGLVSPLMVIVVAFTAIASFATPTQSCCRCKASEICSDDTCQFFRAFRSDNGTYGPFDTLLLSRSFGVPFLEPLAPIILSDLKDALIRFPWWSMTTRRNCFQKPHKTGAKPETESRVFWRKTV